MVDPTDQVILMSAALEGLRLQKKRLEKQIENLENALKSRPRPTNDPALAILLGAAETPEARLSEEGRERISSAQKKRWEEYRRRTRRESVRTK